MGDVLDRESAEAEFDRFVDSMNIDMDVTGIDENDKRDLLKDRAVVLRSLQKGTLVIDDSGFPIFTTMENEEIHFRYMTGQMLSAMDYAKKDHSVGKMYKSMAAATKKTEAFFNGMNLADVKVCMSIWNLFLA